MDWQGSLSLICRQRWHDNHKEHKHKQWTPLDWRRSCKQQWLKRQINSEEHFKKRVRIEAWKQAKEDIEAQYEGETRKEFRAHLIRKSGRLALSITAGILKLKPEQ